MKTIEIEPGRNVACDLCGDDWTDRTESGGALMGTYAVCPKCANGMTFASGDRFCPEGKSFADWVREDLR